MNDLEKMLAEIEERAENERLRAWNTGANEERSAALALADELREENERLRSELSEEKRVSDSLRKALEKIVQMSAGWLDVGAVMLVADSFEQIARAALAASEPSGEKSALKETKE